MEFDRIWNDWEIDSLLGRGSFGSVYKIVRNEFGYRYFAAMKVMEVPQNPSGYLH